MLSYGGYRSALDPSDCQFRRCRISFVRKEDLVAYAAPRKNKEFFDRLGHELILAALVLCCVAVSVEQVLLTI